MRFPLFAAGVTAAIERALGERPGGPVAVLGPVRVGKALAARGHAIVAISDKPRALRRVSGLRTYGSAAVLPLADAVLAALVGFGLSDRDDWEPVLAEWSRAVADGGLVVLVDRAPPTELTRRALCGGLADIAQLHARRTSITSGRVRKL